MKKVLQFCFFAIAVFLTSLPVIAQPGWLWARSNTAPFDGYVEASPITTDRAGNAFIAGYFMLYDSLTIGATTLHGKGSMFVAKSDSSGNFLWAINTSLAYCNPTAIGADAAGNMYVTGFYSGNDSLQFGSFTLLNPSLLFMNFIAKISPSGIVIWAKNIAGSAGVVRTWGGLDVAADNVYVTGSYNVPVATIGAFTLTNSCSTGDSTDIYVAKYDAFGNVLWAKSFGGHGNETARAISVTPAGYIYVLGESASPTVALGTYTLVVPYFYLHSIAFVARLDNNGATMWGRAMDLNTDLADIKATRFENACAAGSYVNDVVLGHDSLHFFGTLSQTLLVNFDSSGSIVWARAATADYNSAAYKLTADTCGNIWVSGFEFGIFHCDTFSFPQPTPSSDPMFLAAWNKCGNYISGSCTILASGGDDECGLALDNFGNLYAGGDYHLVALGVGPDTLSLPIGFDELLLLAKYRIGAMPCSSAPCPGVPLPANNVNATTHEVRLFPNPANNEFTIESDEAFTAGSRIDICDLSGRLFFTSPLPRNNSTISVSSFAPGVYQCSIICGNGQVAVKKLVVMK
jgi:Secretion system C-terminal sorting domain